jgi:hypothetical protein
MPLTVPISGTTVLKLLVKWPSCSLMGKGCNDSPSHMDSADQTDMIGFIASVDCASLMLVPQSRPKQ